MTEYWDTDGTALTDAELHDRYDSMLDEVYGVVTVAGLEFDTSRVLKELDPIAYRCGFHDWISGEIDDEQLWEECWTVGNNLPGCIPDGEPEVYGSWSDAWIVLQDDLRAYCDSVLADTMLIGPIGFSGDVKAEANRVLALLADESTHPADGDPVQIVAFGRVHWIAEAE